MVDSSAVRASSFFAALPLPVFGTAPFDSLIFAARVVRPFGASSFAYSEALDVLPRLARPIAADLLDSGSGLESEVTSCLFRPRPVFGTELSAGSDPIAVFFAIADLPRLGLSSGAGSTGFATSALAALPRRCGASFEESTIASLSSSMAGLPSASVGIVLFTPAMFCVLNRFLTSRKTSAR